MIGQFIGGEISAPDPDATIVVIGDDDRAVATIMALLRELGWGAPGIRFPRWIDESLESAIATDDIPEIEVLVDRRYSESAHWLVRAPIQNESFAKVLPLLRDPRYLVIVPGISDHEDDQTVQDGDAAWLTGQPRWLATVVHEGASTLLISADAVVEHSLETIDMLSTFVVERDAGKLACASSWVRLFQSFADLPFGTFKVNGSISRATTQGGRGWAYIEGVDAPVDLEIRVNGQSTVVPATLPRPDLKTRGFHPTGDCGFSFVFPPEAAVTVGDAIHVRVVGDSRELINSPALALMYERGKNKKPPPSALLGEIVKPPDKEAIVELPNLPRHKPRSSGRVFVTTLWALLLREIRARFGTQRGAYVWGLLQPLAQVLIFTVAIRGLKGRYSGTIYGEDALFFFLIALLPYRMFSQAVSGGRVKAGSSLFNFRQVRPVDVSLVYAFLEFATYGVILAFLLTLANWLGYSYTIDQPLVFLYCIFLLFWLGFSIGLFFDVLAVIFPPSRMILGVFMVGLYLLSGVFFSIASVPREWQPYLLWNPMLHIVDELRASSIQAYPLRGDLNYAAECALVMLFIALAFYRRNLFRLF